MIVQQFFEIDETSPVPLYEQLLEQAALAVAAGRLAVGDGLPSVRNLAAELRINPNTAARALREMERYGLAEARRGLGSVVAEGARQAAGPLARRALARQLGGVVDVGRQLGLDLTEIQAALAERWEEANDGHRG